MEGEPILKKTLVTMAAMVGACVVFVGTLSLVAVLGVSRAVADGGSGPALGPAETADAPSSWPAESADRKSGAPSTRATSPSHAPRGAIWTL